MGYQLVMIRHGESVWNQKNLFTGWTDVCYTSYLQRAIHTANHVLQELNEEWIPVIKTWKLNERHYGALQGLNKSETAEKYGEAQVKVWRRSFDVQPPALEPTDERNPAGSLQERRSEGAASDRELKGHHRKSNSFL